MHGNNPPMNASRNAGRPRPFPDPGAPALLLLPLVLSLVAVAGCDAEPRHESVSGAVTLDGKPLDDAEVRFTPDGGEGLTVGSLAQNGRYSLPNPPGLIPGKYRVSISARGSAAASPGTPPDLDLARPGGPTERIPARYNHQTTLRAEVSAGGPNTYEFELSGQPDPAQTQPNRR